MQQEVEWLEAQALQVADGTDHLQPLDTRTLSSIGDSPGAAEMPVSYDLNPLSEIEMGTIYAHGTYTLASMVRAALLAGNDGPHGPSMLNKTFNTTNRIGPTTTGIEELQDDSLLGYIDNYFNYIHPTFPFLIEENVRECFQSLALRKRRRVSNKITLYMVLAIGAIIPSTACLADAYNSMKFFLHATKERYSYKETPDTVQILLLFTLYSLFDPCTGSSWHLVDLCTRTCIKLGFHREDTLNQRSSLKGEEVSHNRAIFWVTYILDR